MLLLPTFNATLQPCAVGPAAFQAHPQGHFCSSCQRVVQDFSHSANPMADLAAARAAAPDGRVCGRFRAAQVQSNPPFLTRRLRWFLVALMLVLGQGLTAREALAQVRRGGINYEKQAAKPPKERSETAKRDSAKLADNSPVPFFGMVVEQMPTFQGGGIQKAVQYIQRQIVWPQEAGKIVQAEGRVFASFTVGTDGRVRTPRVIKGVHPLLDAEVLRVIRAMPDFKPGKQNGKPVAIDLTVPVAFKLR